MSEEIRTVLVASGSGTDANAVMTAYRKGQLLPQCEIVSLLSTKAGVGCPEKAVAHNIPSHVILRHGMFEPEDGGDARKKTQEDFESEVSQWLWDNEVQLVFLLGCIHRMPANCLACGSGRLVMMYNIHPADPLAHGGQGMYGLEPHKHVLAEILDWITRGQRREEDKFFTYPTVHRVTVGYDQGSALLAVAVPVPPSLIYEAQTDLEQAATKLQQVVLPHEHLMLPAAVNLACHQLMAGLGGWA